MLFFPSPRAATCCNPKIEMGIERHFLLPWERPWLSCPAGVFSKLISPFRDQIWGPCFTSLLPSSDKGANKAPHFTPPEGSARWKLEIARKLMPPLGASYRHGCSQSLMHLLTRHKIGVSLWRAMQHRPSRDHVKLLRKLPPKEGF